MSKRILLLVLILAGTSQAQWGSGGSRFYWSKNGSAQKTDSIRFVAGTNVTLTPSNNTLTVAASGAAANSIDSSKVVDGSLINADIRVSTLDSTRIKPSGITQSDIRVSTLDSSRIAPSGITQTDIRVSTLDSSRIAPNGITQTDIRVSSIDSSRIVPAGIAPNDLALSKVFAWTGNHSFSAIVTKNDLLDLAAGMWLNSPTTGTVDSTVAGVPMKMFSTSDTAFCDIFLPAHFSSLDSMVVLGGTISTLGDSAAFSLQVKTVARRGAFVGAFNTAAIDSSDLGTANTQAFWKFTSFGTVTAFKTLRIKMWRSTCTNNTGSDVYMERVILYGKGLR